MRVCQSRKKVFRQTFMAKQVVIGSQTRDTKIEEPLLTFRIDPN